MDYQILDNEIRGCYRYVEGDERESFWVDSQNCYYYTYEDEDAHFDDKTQLLNGKRWWMIDPVKPHGTIITKENQNLVKWVVFDGTDDKDSFKEWDFKNHCPTENKLNIRYK